MQTIHVRRIIILALQHTLGQWGGDPPVGAGGGQQEGGGTRPGPWAAGHGKLMLVLTRGEDLKRVGIK